MNDMMEYWKQEWNTQRQGLNKWRETWELTADQSEATKTTPSTENEWAITDNILIRAQQLWFPQSDSPSLMTIENVPNDKQLSMDSNNAMGLAPWRPTYRKNDKVITRISLQLFFNKRKIEETSSETGKDKFFILFYAMGHELVHISQYMAMIGNVCPKTDEEMNDFKEILDFYAYQFQFQIDRSFRVPSVDEAVINRMEENHPDWFNLLNWRNFRWTNLDECRNRYDKYRNINDFPNETQ